MRVRLALSVTVLVLLAACGGGKSADEGKGAEGAPAAAAVSNVPLTGTIIEITMTTDDKGNYFQPSKIEAKPGDVLRFKLVTGVHNVNFLPDSNPGRAGLPPMSPFLQLPGQTYDLPLTFGTGKFYFQCDPHAALGMVGWLEVEQD